MGRKGSAINSLEGQTFAGTFGVAGSTLTSVPVSTRKRRP